ncbi:LysR family transcriptional regulator [Vibrio astriarenae]|uniref:LysR family transcriptional regulator n=1 Tax=Vibrio astriarenae TaxID=1481923 RepID=UPI003736529F
MRTGNLELFVKVAELGSFSAVAKLEGLPRANVSRRIAELEQELEITLFNRSTRHLSLTPLGKLFFGDISVALNAMTTAHNNLKSASSKPTGRVKLGLPPTNDIRILSLIDTFQSKYPEIEVELHYTHNCYQEFYNGGLDIGLHYGEIEPSDLIAKKLASSTKKLVVSPSYIKRYGEPSSLEELSTFPCACYRWPNGEVEDNWVTNSGSIKVNRKIVSNNFDMLLRAISDGMGVGYLPGTLIQDALNRGDIVQIIPTIESEVTNAYIVYPKRGGVTLANQLLTDFLVEEIPNLISSS